MNGTGVAPGTTTVDGRGFSRTFGIVLIVIGVLSILLPLVAGIAITAIVGWLVILAGIAHFAYGWHARSTGAVVWQFLIGVLN